MARNLQIDIDMRCLFTMMTIGFLASCDLDPAFLTSFEDQRVVSSAGTVRLAPEGNPAIDAVHVRVSLTNVAADASTAVLVAPDHTAIHTFAIRGDLSTLPFVSLDTHQRRELDFFFPVGIDPTTATFEWAGIRSTLAAHVELDDRAGAWWFQTTPAWSTFNHRDGVITTRPPTTATIVRTSEIDREPPTEECDRW